MIAMNLVVMAYMFQLQKNNKYIVLNEQMKQYWHTGTLFIRWWKYKWANRYNYCTECKTCKFRHKGRGLCTSCWDKQRASTPNRIETRKKACLKHHRANYRYIPREEWKPMWPKRRLTLEEKRKYQREWQRKNKFILSFLSTDESLPFPKYKGYAIKLDFATGTPSEIEDKTKLFTLLKAWIDKRTK